MQARRQDLPDERTAHGIRAIPHAAKLSVQRHDARVHRQVDGGHAYLVRVHRPGIAEDACERHHLLPRWYGGVRWGQIQYPSRRPDGVRDVALENQARPASARRRRRCLPHQDGALRPRAEGLWVPRPALKSRLQAHPAVFGGRGNLRHLPQGAADCRRVLDARRERHRNRQGRRPASQAPQRAPAGRGGFRQRKPQRQEARLTGVHVPAVHHSLERVSGGAAAAGSEGVG